MNYEDEAWDFYKKVKRVFNKYPEVKNYKELCKVLKEKPKSGDSKTSQLKYWNNFFSYKRSGHSYKNICVKTPEEVTEYLQNRIADDVLMYLFYNLIEEYYSNHNGILAITSTELACLLGFTNESFADNLKSKPLLAYDLENYLLSINNENSENFIRKKQMEIEKFRRDKNFSDRNILLELEDYQNKMNDSNNSWIVNHFSTYNTSFTVEDFMQHTFLSYYNRINRLINRIMAQDSKMVDKILFGVFRKRKDGNPNEYIYYTRELTGEEKNKMFEIQTNVFKKYKIQSIQEAYSHSIYKSVSNSINLTTLHQMDMLNSFSVYFFASSANTATFNKENFEKQLINNNSNFILSVNEAKGKRLLQYRRSNKNNNFLYHSYDTLSDENKENYQIASYLYEILSEKLLKLNVEENSVLTDFIFQKSIQRYNSHNDIVLKEKELMEKNLLESKKINEEME